MARVDIDTREEGSFQEGMEVITHPFVLAYLESSDEKPTSKGDGAFSEGVFVIVEPDDVEGRKVWARYNIKNKSKRACTISQIPAKSCACMSATSERACQASEPAKNTKKNPNKSYDKESQTSFSRARISTNIGRIYMKFEILIK